MTYKTLLAVLQDETDAPRVLDCVVPLSERLSAHVIGVHSEGLPFPYATPMGFPDADFMVTSAEVNKERSDALKSVFEARMQRSGLSAEWRALQSFSGDSAASSLESARAVDLIVVQQNDPNASSASRNVDALLLETGRPVLFVPYALPVNTSFEKILIGWNGTREATRAVFDALPFIREAKTVEVFTVDPERYGGHEAMTAGGQIAAALSRHGANVTVNSQPKTELSHGEAVANRASEFGADLLVTGAYSQSKLKEFFFGGVTRSILTDMPTATFMSR
jgi:nucleotide-binding universal stress UspA family protein